MIAHLNLAGQSYGLEQRLLKTYRALIQAFHSPELEIRGVSTRQAFRYCSIRPCR
jgi:hypothetical protein